MVPKEDKCACRGKGIYGEKKLEDQLLILNGLKRGKELLNGRKRHGFSLILL